MKQLTGLDTSFLTMETATQFGHVNSISILDPSGSRTGDLYADLRQAVAERLHLLEVYRRKLVRVPFGLDNPYWVDDGDLDLEYHIRELALPAPGRRRPAGRAGVAAGRPTTRPHPPALGVVRHHRPAGRAGRAVHQAPPRHDRRRVGRRAHPRAAGHRARGPRDRATVGAVGARAHAHVARSSSAGPPWRSPPGRARSCGSRSGCSGPPADMTGNPAARQLATSALPSLRGRRETGLEVPALPTRPAPPTPFNKSITAHRRFAFKSLQLADAQTVKRAFGVTVNDVVMAMCAASLRRYLVGQGRPARRPARRDGAGVGAHGQGDRHLQQPGVGHHGVAAHRRRRSRRAADGDPPLHGRGQGAAAGHPRRRADRPHPVHPAGPGGPGGSPGRGHQDRRPCEPPVQPDHLQRPRAAAAALPGGRGDEALLPGVGRRRRDRPEHDGPELPRQPRLRSDRLPGARCPTSGTSATSCPAPSPSSSKRPRACRSPNRRGHRPASGPGAAPPRSGAARPPGGLRRRGSSWPAGGRGGATPAGAGRAPTRRRAGPGGRRSPPSAATFTPRPLWVPITSTFSRSGPALSMQACQRTTPSVRL